MKPSEATTPVKRCPVCGKKGYAEFYLPRDKSLDDKFEIIVHHGLLASGRYRGLGRNAFCRTGKYDYASKDEIIHSRRANPSRAPNVKW